jgi:hypothetical protein
MAARAYPPSQWDSIKLARLRRPCMKNFGSGPLADPVKVAEKMSKNTVIPNVEPSDAGPSRFPRKSLASLAGLTCLAIGLCGCQTVSFNGGGGSGPPNPNTSGNWQINFTPKTGPALFPYASGYILENITDSGSTKFTTAELTATAASGCFVGENGIFATGSVDGTDLALGSASVNGQFLNMNSTLNADSTEFTGTYSVTGGCGNGYSGTIAAQLYAPLTGTYSGTISGSSPAQTIELQITQNGLGNGNGDFLVTGSLVATGFCFAGGSIVIPNSFVSGSAATLNFQINDASGAEVMIKGTLDVAADTLTVSSIDVSSEICGGSYGAVVLTRAS